MGWLIFEDIYIKILCYFVEKSARGGEYWRLRVAACCCCGCLHLLAAMFVSVCVCRCVGVLCVSVVCVMCVLGVCWVYLRLRSLILRGRWVHVRPRLRPQLIVRERHFEGKKTPFSTRLAAQTFRHRLHTVSRRTAARITSPLAFARLRPC